MLDQIRPFWAKLVEGKNVTLEYDNYKGDKFGRILVYLIVDSKNISVELARKGLAQRIKIAQLILDGKNYLEFDIINLL